MRDFLIFFGGRNVGENWGVRSPALYRHITGGGWIQPGIHDLLIFLSPLCKACLVGPLEIKSLL